MRTLIRPGIILLLALTASLLWSTPGPAAATGAAGWGHTCAVTTEGGVKCWGKNGAGELGDGTTTNRSTPVDATGLTGGVASVAAGQFHTCALTTPGGVKCWGHNLYGQLGTATSETCFGDPCSPTPVEVIGLSSGVAAVAAGGGHTCALTTAGGVKCWGWNFAGQLGDGTTDDTTTPVDVTGLTSGVAAVAAGGFHNCALTTAGGVKCWGRNNFGQLGDGTTTNRTTPVDAASLTSGVAAVAAGSSHTCALTTAGGVKCWGHNENGQLGDGTTTNRNTPVDVTGLTSGVAAVAAGGFHNCARTTASALKCWGLNLSGQLGTATSETCFGDPCSPTPLDVTGLTSDVAVVAAGGHHNCALTTPGGLKCWGWNFYGQLGDGQACGTTCATPVDVVGLTVKTPPAVLLVHGAGSSCSAMNGLKTWLETTKGLTGRVDCFDYDSACWGVRESARRLGEKVNDFKVQMGVDKVYIAAHSLGGIVSRYYVEERNGALNVAALVMVGTPNHGIEGADLLSSYFDRCGSLPGGSNRAFEDLHPTSEVLTDLNGDWSGPPLPYRTIAGTADSAVHIRRRPPIIGVEPANDCLVLVSSVELTNVTNSLVVRRHHSGPPCAGVSATALMESTDTVFPTIWDAFGIGGGAGLGASLSNSAVAGGGSVDLGDLRPLAGLFQNSLAPLGAQSHQVSVDANVGEVFFLLSWQDDPGTPSLVLTLDRPDGSPVDPGDPGVTHAVDSDADEWRVDSPPSGTWVLNVTAGAGSEDAAYVLFAVVETDVNLSISRNQANYDVGGVAQVRAEVAEGGVPVTGATVTSQIMRPDGSSQALTLLDDGLHGDGSAGDGVYGVSVILDQCGTYDVVISADLVLPQLVHREARMMIPVAVLGDATLDPCSADDDGDGATDADELAFGSAPLDPASLPEHRFFDQTKCFDGLDNDADTLIDALDPGCAGAVGGIAELPEVAGTALETGGSSGGSAGVLAGIAAAAGVITLGGAAWYARRRWQR